MKHELSIDDIIEVAVLKGGRKYTEDEEIFVISDRVSVRFRLECFKGMVGENMAIYDAKLLWMDDEKDLRVEKLTYEDLKKLYKFIEGRSERISFWRWMNQFSPKMQEMRDQDEMNEILRIVK